MLRARVSTVIAFALAAALALPAGAAARSERELGEVFVKSGSSPVAANTVTAADATCPRRSALVGGGYEAGPLGPEGPFVVGSYRIKGRGWRAVGGQGPTPHSATITSYALCQRGARKLKRVLTSAPIPPAASFDTGTVGVPVSCPTGMKSVAGGFLGEAETTAGAAVVQATYKQGAEGWVNSAISLGGVPVTRKFTSIVYCAVRDVTAIAQSGQVAAGNPPQLAEATTAGCTGFLQTGGFRMTPPTSTGGFLVPIASRPANARKPVDQGWLVRAAEISGSGFGSLTAISYCR